MGLDSVEWKLLIFCDECFLLGVRLDEISQL